MDRKTVKGRILDLLSVSASAGFIGGLLLEDIYSGLLISGSFILCGAFFMAEDIAGRKRE